VRVVARTCPVVPRGHACPLCMSDCDSTTALKRLVRDLERDVLLLSFALVEARELRGFALAEIRCRFPEAA
jgi:hypothetical protein